MMCRQYRDKWLQAQAMSKKDRAYHVFYLWDNKDFRYLSLFCPWRCIIFSSAT
jgi:hypothetical protein